MSWKKYLARIVIVLPLVICAFALAQEDNKTPPAEEEETPVSGGVPYNPERNLEDKLRDPFKSPFELEQEKKAAQDATATRIPDIENRLPYAISELELRGIYLQAKTGYMAIFRVGDDYKWWPAGTKFQDADLVNITDAAVIFKHYTSDEDVQVREVVKELRRGEE
jgi:hypothetical protein